MSVHVKKDEEAFEACTHWMRCCLILSIPIGVFLPPDSNPVCKIQLTQFHPHIVVDRRPVQRWITFLLESISPSFLYLIRNLMPIFTLNKSKLIRNEISRFPPSFLLLFYNMERRTIDILPIPTSTPTNSRPFYFIFAPISFVNSKSTFTPFGCTLISDIFHFLSAGLHSVIVPERNFFVHFPWSDLRCEVNFFNLTVL